MAVDLKMRTEDGVDINAEFDFRHTGVQTWDIELETDEGTRVRLSDYEGKNVVLFFYPKDNTSG